jgi:hypothetical protein
MKVQTWFWSGVLLPTVFGFGADFRNLDFEQADTSGLVPGTGAVGLVEKLVPFWKLYCIRSIRSVTTNISLYFSEQFIDGPMVILRFNRIAEDFPQSVLPSVRTGWCWCYLAA